MIPYETDIIAVQLDQALLETFVRNLENKDDPNIQHNIKYLRKYYASKVHALKKEENET